MSRFVTISDVWNFLDAIPKFQSSGIAAANFSLDNIRSFCEKLGNPQENFPSIHVAGTNGKGTTCYLLEKIYNDAGYNTGMFISPHLLRYNERVRVNSEEISDDDLLRFFSESEALLESIPLSYFEISTALAFWYFSDQQVDIAIIETGLGGRLDSTNVINSEAAVITSIGLDHQDVLGSTLEEIAKEKAGIIKAGKPVIVGNIEGNALEVIRKSAKYSNSELFETTELDPEWTSGYITLKKKQIRLSTPLKESVNRWNVACAWKVCEVLNHRFPVAEKKLVDSIEAFEGAPGRFEKLHSKFDWYFSGSHNNQAIESSLEAVRRMNSSDEAVIIFSAMKDKVNEDFLMRLKSFKSIYFVEQKGDRAAKFEDISVHVHAEKLEENNAPIILDELKTELVIFIGSFYFYPIVKRWINNI